MWTLPGGEPDLIVTSPPYTTKANGHESWAEMFADIPLTEDRWVSAYQSRPSKDGTQVVHHMVGYIVLPDGTGDGYGLHYVPGKPATVCRAVVLSHSRSAAIAGSSCRSGWQTT